MKLNYKRTILVGFAFFIISAFWQAYDAIVPKILTNLFDMDQASSGFIMSLDNILAVFLLPIFGALSDKVKTPFGKRTPFILIGTLCAVAAFVGLGFISSPNLLWLFILVLLLTLLSMATFRSPAVALMPDVTIKPLRSKGNAIINLMGTLGGSLVLGLGMIFGTGATKNTYMSYIGFFCAVAGIMIICLFAFMLTVRERRFVREMEDVSREYGVDEQAEGDNNGDRSLSRGELGSLILLLASVALWYAGYNAVVSKYSVYAGSVLNLDYNSTLLVANVAALAAYIPVGIIASKVGRKKTIIAGVLMLGTSFLVASFLENGTPLPIMMALFSLAGIGWATINVNSFPMVVELARGGNVGRYTGFYYTASMAAQTVTPVVSGWCMDMLGMKALFPYATIFVAGALITMSFVRHGDSKPAAKGKLEALAGED